MKCKKCNSEMSRNGKRKGKQRYKCPQCKYEKEESLSSNILCIPDLHIPFEHTNALRFVSDLKREYNCGTVIQLGDITDQYCFSRYLRDPDALSVREEVKRARASIKDWAIEFPEMMITRGNHCARLHKRLYEIGIPSDVVLQTTNDIFGMPKKWTWHGEVTINDITYMHGFKSGEMAHVATARSYRNSVVIGHTHSSLAVQYLNGRSNRIFGANAGCLVDQESYAFIYAREAVNKSVLGAIVMIDGIHPIAIPMEV